MARTLQTVSVHRVSSLRVLTKTCLSLCLQPCEQPADDRIGKAVALDILNGRAPILGVAPDNRAAKEAANSAKDRWIIGFLDY